jgi:hypothetical protein
MKGDLNSPLSPEEFRSLRELSKPLMKPSIPEAHAARLIELGYVVQKLGGLRLTDAGELRIMRGR